MSKRLDVTEPNDLSMDTTAPDAVHDSTSDAPASPEQQDEARDAIAARIRQIEAELVAADAEIKNASARMIELQRERDRLNAQQAPKAGMTQAQAYAAIVAASQSLRAQRFAQVQQFKNITGGVFPVVETPAERAAKSRPRT
jgi:hypothetical protein